MIFIQLAGKFAGLFSSSTFLIIGSVVLLKAMSLDYAVVLNACKWSFAAASVAGLIGYHMGKIFEKSNYTHDKPTPVKKNQDLLIDDILDNDLDGLDDEAE